MAQTFGDEEQGILDSFMGELADWEDTFLDLSNLLADPAVNMALHIEEIFRGVHSLKGGAAFIAEIDPRMGALMKYCHAYETLLHDLRLGQIPLDASMRELTREGLIFLSDGAHAINGGGVFPEFSLLVEKFSKTLAQSKEADSTAFIKVRSIGDMAEIVEEEGLLIIRLLRDVRYSAESRDLAQALAILTSSANPASRIAYDFEGRWRISSIVVGQIIASLPSFSEVAVLNCVHGDLTWRRFHFRELGILMYPDLAAWRAARRMEVSDAR